ncbi:MAG: succinylglutamate desuccinylase/aspartoacylase family protein [Patescibacteria group bacterium]|nr:succinylglutamate desuccinylase/aspartoacylase family protein [Patescibacteria group bacterium]
MTIIAGTHGDEWSGIDVLDFILSNNIPKNLQQGSLQLIIANIEALKANKRYADHDLNRIW